MKLRLKPVTPFAFFAALLVFLVLGACNASEPIQHDVAIVEALPAVSCNPPSGLRVPKTCPLYAPGGGPIASPYRMLPEGLSALCAVDDTGAAYGMMTFLPVDLAVIPGNREIGIYVGFEPGSGFAENFTDEKLNNLEAEGFSAYLWAAAKNVHGTTECCSEDVGPSALIPNARVVAKGPQGLLLSAGRFGSAPLQVAGALIDLDRTLSYWFRFYVDSPPPLPSGSP